MNLNDARLLIERIVTTPTSEKAISCARELHSLAFEPAFNQALLQMTREEYECHGHSSRHQALIRLGEHTSALVRNRLLEALPGNAPEAPPDLIVLAEASPPPQQVDDELKEAAGRRKERERMWQAVTHHFFTPAAVPCAAVEPLDDLARSRLAASIDSRLLQACLMLNQSRANEGTLVLLEEVVRDCDRLLNAGPSKYNLIPPERVRAKRADALKYLARTYNVLRDVKNAQSYNERAAEAMRKIDKPEEALACRVDMVAMMFNHGNLPQKIEAVAELRQILQEIPQGQEYVGHLMTLGEMYSALGEDYEADRALNEAEERLQALNATNPTGIDLADALESSLRAVYSGKTGPSSAAKIPIVEKIQLRSFYRRLYTLRQQIYRGRGDAAREAIYHKLLEQQAAREKLDGTIAQGNQINTEFSQQMIQRLDSLLKSMENRPKKT